MDAQRSYPDESERWYGGGSGYGGAPDWDKGGADDRFGAAAVRHVDGGYRVLDPRGAEPGVEAGPVDRYPPEPGRPVSDLGRPVSDLGRPVSDLGRPVSDPGRPVSDPGRPPFDPTYDPGGLGVTQTGQMPPLGRRSGEPMPPPMAPTSQLPPVSRQRDPVPGLHGEPADGSGRRSGGPVAPVGDGVYRTRRPAAAVVLGLLAAGFELPAVRVLMSGAFADHVSASGVVAGTTLVIGLPILAMGLYAAVTGAGRTPVAPGDRPWLRPPLAYLTVGLTLLVAAALAAG